MGAVFSLQINFLIVRLVFGDGTSTAFLGEAEVEAYKLATGIAVHGTIEHL